MCDALLAGDADAAADAIATHLAGACETIFRNLAARRPARARLPRLAAVVGGLDREHRAVRVEQDALRLAAGDAACRSGVRRRRPITIRLRLIRSAGVDELVGGLVPAHLLVDLVDDAGGVEPGPHASSARSEANRGSLSESPRELFTTCSG